MKCKKCGYEYEGVFCPECGTKNEESSSDKFKAEQENQVEKNDLVNGESCKLRSKKEKSKEDVPWYLSIPFIVVIYCLSFCFWGIPGIILGIIRIINCKTKRKSSLITLICLIIPWIFMIWAIVLSINDTKEVEKLIDNGKYAEARQLLDEKMQDDSSFVYIQLYCESYETEGKYDEAAQVMIDYCNSCDSPLDIHSSALSKLNNLEDKVSLDMYEQIIEIEKKVECAKAEQTEQEEKRQEEEKQDTEEKKSDYNEMTKEDEQDDSFIVCDVLINIFYEKNTLSYNDDVIIYVDGERIGKMKAGDSSSFEVVLDAGEHIIQVKSDTTLRHNDSNKFKFECEYEFQEVSLNVKDESFGGLKISSND